ncbi:MAG TPA: hypothetical protein DC015_15820, partial [Aequorivita sp.]|nr:hypothetical protein [Aequorivita sp.]
MLALFFVHLVEFLAFLTGLIYYQKNKSKPTLYLVWFLGITVCSEIFGWYAYFVENGFLYFLKGTPFESNYWWANIYTVISYLFYVNYFKWYLSAKKSVTIINRVSIVFLIFSILEIV